jgi:hypothetical protein
MGIPIDIQVYFKQNKNFGIKIEEIFLLFRANRSNLILKRMHFEVAIREFLKFLKMHMTEY